jgi:hypothetical protein
VAEKWPTDPPGRGEMPATVDSEVAQKIVVKILIRLDKSVVEP